MKKTKLQKIVLTATVLLLVAALSIGCVTIKIYPVSKIDTVAKLIEVEQYQYLDIKK
jgi:hypothetical protein